MRIYLFFYSHKSRLFSEMREYFEAVKNQKTCTETVFLEVLRKPNWQKFVLIDDAQVGVLYSDDE